MFQNRNEFLRIPSMFGAAVKAGSQCNNCNNVQLHTLRRYINDKLKKKRFMERPAITVP